MEPMDGGAKEETCPVVELVRYDLRDPKELEQFKALFSKYLKEVCDPEEYAENIAELADQELTHQMVTQTLRERDPYFIMKIVLDGSCAGFISYSFFEKKRGGFINNFYLRPEYRHTGLGGAVCQKVEAALKSLGVSWIELEPVEGTDGFYRRAGFIPFRKNGDGLQVYRKELV